MNNFTEDVVIKNITYTIWNTLYFSRDAFKRILNIFYIQENIKVILFLRMRREGVEKAIPVIPHFVSHLLMMVNVTTKKIKWWYAYNRQDSSDFDSIFWLWLWLFIICESSKFDLINFLLNKSRKSARRCSDPSRHWQTGFPRKIPEEGGGREIRPGLFGREPFRCRKSSILSVLDKNRL